MFEFFRHKQQQRNTADEVVGLNSIPQRIQILSKAEISKTNLDQVPNQAVLVPASEPKTKIGLSSDKVTGNIFSQAILWKNAYLPSSISIAKYNACDSGILYLIVTRSQ